MTTPESSANGSASASTPVARANTTAATSPVATTTELLRTEAVGKQYGQSVALADVSLEVNAGEVTCVLGDNGAGKSTLIKILAGLHAPSSGTVYIDGEEVHLRGPKDAMDRGISTVFQHLAVVGEMPVWRNFFLGHELVTGPSWLGPLRPLDRNRMRSVTDQALREMGIELPHVDMDIANLSGGQRQVVAIARAIHFGARVIILDEPTAALGVKQSGMVLRFVQKAKEQGLGVILITHNPHHAHLVGDRFVLLGRGEVLIDATYDEITLDELTRQMAGGAELETLAHELER